MVLFWLVCSRDLPIHSPTLSLQTHDLYTHLFSYVCSGRSNFSSSCMLGKHVMRKLPLQPQDHILIRFFSSPYWFRLLRITIDVTLFPGSSGQFIGNLALLLKCVLSPATYHCPLLLPWPDELLSKSCVLRVAVMAISMSPLG